MDGRIRNVVFDAAYAGSLELYSEAAGAIATLYSQVLGMRKRMRAELYRQANYPADAGDEVDPIVVPADEDGIGIASRAGARATSHCAGPTRLFHSRCTSTCSWPTS